MQDYLKKMNQGVTNAFTSFQNRVTPQKTTTTPVVNQPQKPVVSNTSAATSPTPTVIKQPTLATPAAKTYVDSQLNKSNLNANISALNAGATTFDPATGNWNNPTTTQPTTPQTNTETTKPSANDAYLKYLTGLSSNLETAGKDREEKLKKLASVQSANEKQKLDSLVQRNNILDSSGMLKGGAEQSASVAGRRADTKAAYGAIEELAASRSAQIANDVYDSYINAGKTVYEATVASNKAEADAKQQIFDNEIAKSKAANDGQFNLSPGETRYDKEGNVIASGGPKPMTDTQEAAQAAQTEKETAAQQSASQSIGLVNNLLNSDRFKSISGALQTGSVPFLGDRSAVNEYNQLQGLLKLGIRGLLKGQGAVSDYEGKVLGQASSALSRLTNETQMKEALLKVRGVLKTNNGQITTVEVTNPNTGEKITADLSGPEIYQLTSEGNVINYK